ncbi:hypothetical protein D3C80_2101310 [compost metagenome]
MNATVARIKETSITPVAIVPTKTFDKDFPMVPLINAPSKGSKMINGSSCDTDMF